MRGKRILAAALSALMLLASGAQAAVAPKGEEYVEVRLTAASTAMSKEDYVALHSTLAGTADQRAEVANKAFQNGSDHLQVRPGETFYLAFKVDYSHIWQPYVGAGNYNLYYSYDPQTFTFRASDGYINMLCAGQAGIDPEGGDLDYLGNYSVMANSKLQTEDKTYLAIGVISETYKYYIPAKAEWDLVLPVQVSENAYAGTYTIGFEEKNFGGQFKYAIMLGQAANGAGYLQDFGATDLDHLKANDMVIEVVNAPARPDTPQPTEPEETDFTDLPENLWYSAPARAAAKGGLMQGTGKGLFSPLGQLHTAEVVTLCARLHAQYTSSTVPAAKAGEAWYQAAYDYCVKEGLFTAQELPLTQLTELATRFQMVELLDRAVPESEKAPIREGVTVPDVAQTDPYGPVIYRWYAAGITQGDGSGSFHGESFITRGETAAILCRLARLTPRIGA